MDPQLNRTRGGAPAPAGADASAVRFRPVRSPRAFEEIAAQIREELAQGRLRVGSRLPSERALSEQFGVSRNTVREALRSLENAGLIRLQKGASGGAFVAERSSQAITTGLMDMYHLGAIQPAKLTEARIWLESIVVREACRRATDADLAALRENIRLAEQAALEGDFARRAHTHLDFHRMLARMTENPVMVTMMDGLMEVLHHFISRIGDYDNEFVLPSRRRFMKHMEARDVDAAVAEMEALLKRLQRSYLSKVHDAAAPRSTGAAAPAASRPPGPR